MKLRPYQQTALHKMQHYMGNAALVVMATGLGKTVVFTSFLKWCVLQNDWHCLILSHREELVTAPIKYLDDIPCGIELAAQHANHQPIISASTQSLVGRLKHYNPREIDVIIVDEAHHAVAPTYQTILKYFDNAIVFGFTATPKRGDGMGLEGAFDDILCEYDTKWGMDNGYLCPIDCIKATLKYDLGKVKVMADTGDFCERDLAKAMSGTALGVAEIYDKYSRGQTIVFASSVMEAKNIANAINEAHQTTIARHILGTTKSRAQILDDYTTGTIHVLVNFGVLTEGTDLPCTETVIIAKPVAHTNPSAYVQMVGRGLRLYDGKKSCLIIDCVGVSDMPLCTAATLIGKDADDTSKQPINRLPPPPEEEEDLELLAKSPDTWVKTQQKVDVMQQDMAYDTHGVAWFACPDGNMILSLFRKKYMITSPDADGYASLQTNNATTLQGQPLQHIFDIVYKELRKQYRREQHLWASDKRTHWATKRASDKQLALIAKLAPTQRIDASKLTAGDASDMIQRLTYSTATDTNKGE